MHAVVTEPHLSSDLERIFADCFARQYSTVLGGDQDEPLYLPATNESQARIYYRYDYFASALHEIAHWCIAGHERRKLEDYGYWYAADGRTMEQQQAFLTVEVKPQALEWAFSVAAGYPFSVSLDNLNAEQGSRDWTFWQTQSVQKKAFGSACFEQICDWFKTGFPERGQCFIDALLSHYRPGEALLIDEFRGLA